MDKSIWLINQINSTCCEWVFLIHISISFTVLLWPVGDKSVRYNGCQKDDIVLFFHWLNPNCLFLVLYCEFALVSLCYSGKEFWYTIHLTLANCIFYLDGAGWGGISCSFMCFGVPHVSKGYMANSGFMLFLFHLLILPMSRKAFHQSTIFVLVASVWTDFGDDKLN